MGFREKLKMCCWGKKRTINELVKVNKLIDMYSRRLLSRLEELDQKKVYVCKLPGASREELIIVKEAFNEAARGLKWTLPKILFLNFEFKEKGGERK